MLPKANLLNSFLFSVYVNLGQGNTGPAVLSMVTGSTGSSRSFSIKVSQIECTQINQGNKGLLINYITHFKSGIFQIPFHKSFYALDVLSVTEIPGHSLMDVETPTFRMLLAGLGTEFCLMYNCMFGIALIHKVFMPLMFWSSVNNSQKPSTSVFFPFFFENTIEFIEFQKIWHFA